MERYFFCLVVHILLVFAGQPFALAQIETPPPKKQATPHQVKGLWCKNSIIYTVDIDSFKGSDVDGIGDF